MDLINNIDNYSNNDIDNISNINNKFKRSNMEYKKISTIYINLCSIEEKYEKFLNLYLYLYMKSNNQGEIIFTLETLSELLELTYDKRSTKIEEYINLLNLISNDIIINNDIYASKILDFDIILHHDKENKEINNKDLINCKLDILNEDIKDNFIKLYYDEYTQLCKIPLLYIKNKNKRLNQSTLINIYMYLKYIINLKKSFGKKNTEDFEISTLNIAKNTNLNRKTVTSYLNILKDYKMITITQGDYNFDKNEYNCNKYNLNKNWM